MQSDWRLRFIRRSLPATDVFAWRPNHQGETMGSTPNALIQGQRIGDIVLLIHMGQPPSLQPRFVFAFLEYFVFFKTTVTCPLISF
jgi:hypothetical protein